MPSPWTFSLSTSTFLFPNLPSSPPRERPLDNLPIYTIHHFPLSEQLQPSLSEISKFFHFIRIKSSEKSRGTWEHEFDAPIVGRKKKWGLRCGRTIQAIHQPQLRIELPRVTLIPSTGAISRPNLWSFLVYFMWFCAIGIFEGVYGAVSWDFVFLW